jgi:hypothetical protein
MCVMACVCMCMCGRKREREREREEEENIAMCIKNYIYDIYIYRRKKCKLSAAHS